MIEKVLQRVTKNLPCRFINDGNVRYLERYYVGAILGIQFYLHRFIGSDPDDGVHDHPWKWSCSLILSGYYDEEQKTTDTFIRRRFINFIGGNKFHRIHFPPERKEVWTLFFHGKRTKGWGFFNKITKVYRPFALTATDKDTSGWWDNAPTRGELLGDGDYRKLSFEGNGKISVSINGILHSKKVRQQVEAAKRIELYDYDRSRQEVEDFLASTRTEHATPKSNT